MSDLDRAQRSLEHLTATYRQYYRGEHNIHNLQIFYADVLWAVLDARAKYRWRFWKWLPYAALAEQIEREHSKCCQIQI